MEEKKEISNFKCNICLQPPNEPVVTECGHLFCWKCIYQWMQQNNRTLKCPVCSSGLSSDSMVPIYGKDTTENTEYSDKGLPRRPEAKRSDEIPNPHYRGVGGNPSVEIGKFVMGYGLFPSTFVLNFTQGKISNNVPGIQGANQNPEEEQDKIMSVVLKVCVVLTLLFVIFMGLNSTLQFI